MVVSATLSGVDSFVPNLAFMVARPRPVLLFSLQYFYVLRLLLLPVADFDRFEDNLNYESVRTPGRFPDDVSRIRRVVAKTYTLLHDYCSDTVHCTVRYTVQYRRAELFSHSRFI
jgi:hypothetical protein